MKLKNEKLAGMKLAFGSEKVQVDAKGCIEAKEKEIIDALIASGFVPVKKVEEPKVEEVKVEEPKVEVTKAEEVKVETEVEAEPEEPKIENPVLPAKEETTKSWKRNK